MKTISLTRGLSATVDDVDYDKVGGINWSIKAHNRVNYAVGHLPKTGKLIRMHRLIMGVLDKPDIKIDHIDGNGLNNCMDNLRCVTAQQNGFNQRKQIGRSSVYKGVCYVKRTNRWVSNIKHNQKPIYLGTYKKEEDAAVAYNRAAVKYFGEYALLNDIANRNAPLLKTAEKVGISVKQHRSPSTSSSQYKGVSYNRHGKKIKRWAAYTRVKGVHVVLGYYKTELEARDAQLRAEKQHIIKK